MQSTRLQMVERLHFFLKAVATTRLATFGTGRSSNKLGLPSLGRLQPPSSGGDICTGRPLRLRAMLLSEASTALPKTGSVLGLRTLNYFMNLLETFLGFLQQEIDAGDKHDSSAILLCISQLVIIYIIGKRQSSHSSIKCNYFNATILRRFQP